MKAIIQINKKLSLNDNFKAINSSLLSLKICGKTLLSYYLDFLNEVGVKSIYILGKDLESYVDEYYQSEVFPVDLQFSSKDYDEFFEENKRDFSNDELLIIKGLGFIFNSFYNLKEKIFWTQKNFKVEDKGFVLEYIKDVNYAYSISNTILVKSIKTIEDYIYVLDFVLRRLYKVDYGLGYSSEDGIVIGKNVKIEKGVKLEAPIVLLDDVKISKACTIGPNVIVSNDVFIEENTTIKDSFICENTYIGKNLVLENKVISQNKIIEKGSFKEYLVDDRLLSNNK